MKQGEPFNISKAWPELRIPLGMISDRSITFCAKIIYGLLVRYAGSAGFCGVYQEQIARDLGVSKILVKKDIRMLRDQKYIMTVLQGAGRPSIYYFLWNNKLKLKTGGVNRININPEVHRNILEYYKNMEKTLEGNRGQERTERSTKKAG